MDFFDCLAKRFELFACQLNIGTGMLSIRRIIQGKVLEEKAEADAPLVTAPEPFDLKQVVIC